MRVHYFNPRSPDGERHSCGTRRSWPTSEFQSTLPGWGATRQERGRFPALPDFNPRSPDGERHTDADVIHLPFIFQSTLPGWGATAGQGRRLPAVRISIHAPRMGSDGAFGDNPFCPVAISIHAPRMGSDDTIFSNCHSYGISIHAPRMGSDRRGRCRSRPCT